MNRVVSGLLGAAVAGAGILGYEALTPPPELGRITTVPVLAEAYKDSSTSFYPVPGGGFSATFWSESNQDSMMLAVVPTKWFFGLQPEIQYDQQFWWMLGCNVVPCTYESPKISAPVEAILPVPHAPDRLQVLFHGNLASIQLTRSVWNRVRRTQ